MELELSHINKRSFHRLILNWYDANGRKDLPWQKDNDPYKIWLSEIMLQQTQVATVIPYFERFLSIFPNIDALANAEQDDVLTLWSGLGYYARARNLHKCAQIIVSDFHGDFPDSVEALVSLPGIGRSTAGAIMSLAFKKRATILDGNVKRVLIRSHQIDGPADNKATLETLWQLSDYLTPHKHVAPFTQAMMDMGAMICTRSKPNCTVCPLAKKCLVNQAGLQAEYPHKKRTAQKPTRRIVFGLILNGANEILLEKRPQKGIWGGLWSFPELAITQDVDTWCRTQLGLKTYALEPLSAFRHTFSHFHLEIQPIKILCEQKSPKINTGPNQRWVAPQQTTSLGIPAPVEKLLNTLF